MKKVEVPLVHSTMFKGSRCLFKHDDVKHLVTIANKAIEERDRFRNAIEDILYCESISSEINCICMDAIEGEETE
jgi:hypothetical protein